MVVVDDSNFQDEVLNSKIPVLVDFYADWCGPCRMIGPVVEEIAGEFEGRLKVCKLNIDGAQATAAKYRVQSIPFLGFFKDGKLVDNIVGAVPKDAIVQKIQSVI
ncbi:MAG: thioredoxin [bacterium]